MHELLLGVNVDHVATLRQARRTTYPDPAMAAAIAEQNGADSITVHLREDRRHIQEYDLERLAERLTTRMNLELAVAEPVLRIAERLRPADCCLVPERREEVTTEGGLDVAGDITRVREVCARLAAAGIRVAPFIDPDERQIDACRSAGALAVELHTGRYAEADSESRRGLELTRIIVAARHARQLGLKVHAGHGLNYDNVRAVAAIADMSELNIGHAIIAQSLFDGLAKAVATMKQLMVTARRAGS
ncbi:MAG: pyridoxine 5'-phosphate synthase [Gammaproteobacteria bacterium]|nr:pyridoxine 5'-phosphate synthase [Gammaproteobacteria bacterium]